MKRLIAAMGALLLIQSAYAMDPIPGQSPKEKAREEAKKARDRDTEERYRESLKQIPDVEKKPTDPWAGVRTPGATGK